MSRKYTDEREGQLDFYSRVIPRVNPDACIEDIISDNNDGVLNGNLLEFKLNITNLNAHLFQAIKYLSQLRIKGKPVPKNILIVGLNEEVAYCYNAENYLDDIEKVYIGAASRDNKDFSAQGGGTGKITIYCQQQRRRAAC